MWPRNSTPQEVKKIVNKLTNNYESVHEFRKDAERMLGHDITLLGLECKETKVKIGDIDKEGNVATDKPKLYEGWRQANRPESKLALEQFLKDVIAIQINVCKKNLEILKQEINAYNQIFEVSEKLLNTGVVDPDIFEKYKIFKASFSGICEIANRPWFLTQILRFEDQAKELESVNTIAISLVNYLRLMNVEFDEL